MSSVSQEPPSRERDAAGWQVETDMRVFEPAEGLVEGAVVSPHRVDGPWNDDDGVGARARLGRLQHQRVREDPAEELRKR